MAFLNAGIISAQDTFRTSSSRQTDLGAVAHTRDGRRWRYCQAGTSALVAGKLCQTAAPLANHQATTAAVAAIGATSIVGTLGATAADENFYAEGVAIIYVTPGQGVTYGVKSHAAVLASGDLTAYLYGEDGVQVALSTASKISFVQNPYKGVITAPVTTLTGAPNGVPAYPIEASYFGWLQVGGICGLLIDGTPAVGQSVSSPAAAAGAVAINSGTLAIVGVTMIVGVDTKYQQVLLNLP